MLRSSIKILLRRFGRRYGERISLFLVCVGLILAAMSGNNIPALSVGVGCMALGGLVAHLCDAF